MGWRLPLAALAALALVVGAGVGAWKLNQRYLQRPLEHVLADHAQRGRIEARAHYQQYAHPDVLVLDIRGLRGHPTRMDVFTVLLDYASALKQTRFREVLLASNGREKFAMDGAYFQQLGCSYDARDPLSALYLVWEFPAHMFDMQGRRPYFAPQDPVAAHDIDRFGDFMQNWYENDVAVVEKR